MSASAAAIATPDANNTTSVPLDSNSRLGTRRRTAPVTRNKSNTQMLIEGANGTGDDTVVVNGNDPGHTIRDESMRERSREMLYGKRGLATPPAAPRRRKGISRLEEPRRPTVISILSKICFLLVGLLWLGQMIWKWSDMNRNSANPPFAILDYEGQISEVEASFKKMTQMLQVQLEVVDKKIENEVGNVVKELKQVEEKGILFEKELKKLEARSDNLGKSLGELKDMGLFSKEELENLWNELKKSRSIGDSGEGISLDDVRAFAKEIVEKEIDKHAADGLGRVDYALASGGAKVVRHSEPYGFGKAKDWFASVKVQSVVHANAQKMLEPSFGEPGQCFAFQGSSGFVEIRLRTGIIPEAVTIEHISKSVAYDRSSAPKDCRVSAWFEGLDDDPSDQPEKTVLLTEFSYDLEKSNAQTFNVESANLGVINMVRLEFSSNHGSSSLTCIYRFRVHGYEPASIQGVAFQA